MKRDTYAAVWSTSSLALLLGCGTPQAFYDEAKTSAELMASLQAEMDKLAANQKIISTSRQKAIEEMEAVRLSNDSGENRYPARWKLAGMTDKAELYSGLLDLADAQTADSNSLEANLAAAHATVAALLSPLPSSAKDLAKAKSDMTAISVPPTTQERIKFLAQYGKSVKVAVASAASAAASAAKPASAPPAQTPATAAPATPKV